MSQNVASKALQVSGLSTIFRTSATSAESFLRRSGMNKLNPQRRRCTGLPGVMAGPANHNYEVDISPSSIVH